MRNTLIIIAAYALLASTGCAKAKNHCYRCIDLSQVDPARDVCANDTTTAGRNAYATVAAGQPLNNTNGVPDSCMGYDK